MDDDPRVEQAARRLVRKRELDAARAEVEEAEFRLWAWVRLRAEADPEVGEMLARARAAQVRLGRIMCEETEAPVGAAEE